MQLPAWQVSVCVQASPSAQALPSALSGLEHAPLAGSQTPAAWHWSRAAHTTGRSEVRRQGKRVAVWVRASTSAKALPSALSGLEEVLFAGSQSTAAWLWSRVAPSAVLVPMQLPAWQVSVCVQASPSEQALPSALSGLEHVPFAGSQTPAAWHWSRAAHTTGFVPVQVPAWQASVCVQALLSLQALPFGLSGFEQVPLAGSQTPATWH